MVREFVFKDADKLVPETFFIEVTENPYHRAVIDGYVAAQAAAFVVLA